LPHLLAHDDAQHFSSFNIVSLLGVVMSEKMGQSPRCLYPAIAF